MLLWSWAVTILAAWIIIRSGLLPRTKARIEKNKPRPVWVSVFIGAVYLVFDFVLELPLDRLRPMVAAKELCSHQPALRRMVDRAGDGSRYHRRHQRDLP